MKLFIGDLVKVYGRDYPGLEKLGQQIAAFTLLDPARMMLAQKAWPMFSRARNLIERRDEAVFTKHDLAGLKSRANLDTAVIWAKASAKSREAMWRSVEDLCDCLDEINDIRPIAAAAAGAGGEDDADDEPAAQKKSSELAAPSSAGASGTGKPAKTAKGGKKGKGGKKSQELAHEMMSTLKHMVADDEGGMNDDFEAVMKKLGDSDGAEPTEKDQEMMTRLLSNFVNKIAPGGGDDDDADLERLPEKERQAEKARRTIESIQKRNRIKHAIGKLTQIESLQKTSDPSILQREAQEAAAEKDRLDNPEKVQENRLSAHFNYKLCLLLQKLHLVRGNVRSKKDGRIVFPAIKSSFAELLRLFKENPASRAIIEPVGEFIAKHRKKLNRRDDKIFLEPSHTFLVGFDTASLWATFKPDEREAFWDLVAHPISLATIDHDLHTGDLADVAEIVDDILAGSGIAYDTDPKNVNGKEMVMSAIEKGVAPGKLARIHKLFARMSSDPDQKTMRSIHKLMKHVVPQALRARGIDLDLDGDADSGDDKEEDDEDDEDDEEHDSKADAAGAKAAEDIGKRLDAKFAEMLSGPQSAPKPTDAAVAPSQPSQPAAPSPAAARTLAPPATPAPSA
jgi:hypothetical protein